MSVGLSLARAATYVSGNLKPVRTRCAGAVTRQISLERLPRGSVAARGYRGLSQETGVWPGFVWLVLGVAGRALLAECGKLSAKGHKLAGSCPYLEFSQFKCRVGQ